MSSVAIAPWASLGVPKATRTKLIEVEPQFSYDIIDQSNGRMKVGGLYQLADVKNANNRVYRSDLWRRLISSGEVQQRLTNRQMLGELDHPTDGQTRLERVSHVVLNLEVVGNQVRGIEEILDTPMGKILQELYRAKIRVGVSSRGDGTVTEKEGVNYVNDDYQLETFDHVLHPSTPGAYAYQLNPQLEGTVHDPILNLVEGMNKVIRSGRAGEKDLEEYQRLLSCLSNTCSKSRNRMSLIETAISTVSSALNENSRRTSSCSSCNSEIAKVNIAKEGSMEESVQKLVEQQAQVIADRAIAEKATSYAESLGKIQVECSTLRKQNEVLQRDLSVAVALGDEQDTQLKDKSLKVEQYKKRLAVMPNLESDLVKSKVLLREMSTRLKVLRNVERAFEAAKKSLAVTLTCLRSKNVSGVIETLVLRVPKAQQVDVRKALSECKNPKEVIEKFQSLSRIGGFTHKPDSTLPRGIITESNPLENRSSNYDAGSDPNPGGEESMLITEGIISRLTESS